MEPYSSEETASTTTEDAIQVNFSKYNLKEAVKLPEGENPEEWIALNLYDFNKQVRMLYGTLKDYCTNESCSRMRTGKKFEYLWSSGRTNEAPSAPEYIHHLLDWVQDQLNDEDVFPVKEEGRFPQDYMDVAETISKRLFRIYSHIYHHHSQDVRNLKEEAHMNTSLKHFIYFVKEFKLVPSNDLKPMTDYINSLYLAESSRPMFALYCHIDQDYSTAKGKSNLRLFKPHMKHRIHCRSVIDLQDLKPGYATPVESVLGSGSVPNTVI